MNFSSISAVSHIWSLGAILVMWEAWKWNPCKGISLVYFYSFCTALLLIPLKKLTARENHNAVENEENSHLLLLHSFSSLW